MARKILVLPEDSTDARRRIEGITQRWRQRKLYAAPEIAVVYETLFDAIEKGLYTWGAINLWSVSREIAKRQPDALFDAFEECCCELIERGNLTVLDAPLGN